MKRLSVREWSLISERQGVGDGLVFKSLVILYVSAFIIYETAVGVPRFFLHPLRGVCDCFTVCGCPNEPDSRPRVCHICHRVDFFFTQDAEFLSGLFPNIAAATPVALIINEREFVLAARRLHERDKLMNCDVLLRSRIILGFPQSGVGIQ